MQAAERFRDMTIPANRLVFQEDLGKLLGTKIFPLGGLEVRSQQRRSMVEVVNRADRLVAERALLVFIPPRDDIPDEAVVRTDLDLA